MKHVAYQVLCLVALATVNLFSMNCSNMSSRVSDNIVLLSDVMITGGMVGVYVWKKCIEKYQRQLQHQKEYIKKLEATNKYFQTKYTEESSRRVETEKKLAASKKENDRKNRYAPYHGLPLVRRISL